MLQQVPLDSAPNQSWNASLQIDGETVAVFVTLRYNEVASYWAMTLQDGNGNLILDSLPLVTGTNLLGQLAYLGYGSLYIVNVSGVTTPNFPNNLDLGSDFAMIWGDSA